VRPGVIASFTDGELPPFMRDDVAMRLLGINADDEIRE
jgi:hypothetical protein